MQIEKLLQKEKVHKLHLMKAKIVNLAINYKKILGKKVLKVV